MPRKKPVGPKFTGACSEVIEYAQIVYDLAKAEKIEASVLGGSEADLKVIGKEIERRRYAKLVPLFLQLNPDAKPEFAEGAVRACPDKFYRLLATQLAMAMGVPGFQVIYPGKEHKLPPGKIGRPKKYTPVEAELFLQMIEGFRRMGCATDREALRLWAIAHRPELEKRANQGELEGEIDVLANDLAKMRGAAKARARGEVH